MLEFDGQNYYSTKEVAEILHLTQRTIFTKIRNGDLKAKKIGREWFINTDNITEFMGGTRKEIKKNGNV